MKKIFYILTIALISSLSITACTEEEVKPSTDNSGMKTGELDRGGY